MVKKKHLSLTQRLFSSGYITFILAGLFIFFVLTGYSFSVVLNNSVKLLNNRLQQLAVQYNIQAINLPFNAVLSSLMIVYIILSLLAILILYLYVNYRLSQEVK